MKDSPGKHLLPLPGLLRGARWCAWALTGALLMAGTAGAQAPVDEYVVKAAALVELCSYFKWPEPQDAGRSLVVAVVGRSPFGRNLDTYALGRKVQNRKVEVVYVPRPAGLPPCNVVFICQSERQNLASILEWARGRFVLTVADDGELLKKGIMVDLLVKERRLKIYVNPAVVAAEKLGIHSELMTAAEDITRH